MYYRQPSEECVGDCILRGGYRFECEAICRMNPSSANYYSYNVYSMPTTYTPMAPFGISQAAHFSPTPVSYYEEEPIIGGYNQAVRCYDQCRMNGGGIESCCYSCGMAFYVASCSDLW